MDRMRGLAARVWQEEHCWASQQWHMARSEGERMAGVSA